MVWEGRQYDKKKTMTGTKGGHKSIRDISLDFHQGDVESSGGELKTTKLWADFSEDNTKED